MRIRIIRLRFGIATNACSGDYFVMLVIGINKKGKSGLLINISTYFKAVNGYLALLTVKVVSFYTPKELVEIGTSKSLNISHHMMAT